jgi:phage terminase large subunit-like protein
VEFPDLKRVAAALVIRYRPNAMLVEHKSSGIALIQEFRQTIKIDDQIRTLAIKLGYVGSIERELICPPVLPIDVDKDKLARAEAVTPMVERGDCELPDPSEYEVPWMGDYLREMENFTGINDAEDDQVDSTTQLLNYCRGLGSFNVQEHYREYALMAARRNERRCSRCTQIIQDGQQWVNDAHLVYHATCPTGAAQGAFR